MAPQSMQIPLLSPAELDYLHTSLANPGSPIRSDGRSPTQFRPLSAETDVLPGANGSARIGFADGTQAIVGVKAEVERTVKGGLVGWASAARGNNNKNNANAEGDIVMAGDDDDDDDNTTARTTRTTTAQTSGKKRWRAGKSSWVEMTIDIPGVRDDDSLPVFLAEMMREALVGAENGTGTGTGSTQSGDAPSGLKNRLVINDGWHWRLYIDILLLSPPLSYPLPLLSLTTHLALLSTKLPKLLSKDEEDPMFDDDWDAAEWLYPRPSPPPPRRTTTAKAMATAASKQKQHYFRPPVTLLVISVGNNIIFDPTREEISVADVVLAVSVGREGSGPYSEKNDHQHDQHDQHDNDDFTNNNGSEKSTIKLISIRTIDPPARMTNRGIPNSKYEVMIGIAPPSHNASELDAAALAPNEESENVPGMWKPRRGGMKRGIISRIVGMVLKSGGVGEEVMDGLEGVDVV